MTTLLQQCRLLASAPAFAPRVSVHSSLFKEIADHIEQLEARVSLLPPEPEAFDVVAHMSAPSRERPLAAAAAVNMVKRDKWGGV